MADFLGHTQFLIYNKDFHKAKLAQWALTDPTASTAPTEVGTDEYEPNPGQLWTLEEHPRAPGFYYIINEKNHQYRLANWEHKFIVFEGSHFDDQLFKFVSKDDGYYAIQNFLYRDDWLTKHGYKPKEVSFKKFEGGNDQLWRLVPRFEASKLNRVVFEYDNRQGSTPIERDLSVTTGLKRTSTSSISNMTTYKTSLSATLGLSFEGLGLSGSEAVDIEKKLESSFSQGMEQSWSQTENVKFTVPPGKNFKVVQRGVAFQGHIAADTCNLLTSIKVFQSDSSQFDESE